MAIGCILFSIIVVLVALFCGVKLTHQGRLMTKSDDPQRKIMGYILSAIGYILIFLVAIICIWYDRMKQ